MPRTAAVSLALLILTVGCRRDGGRPNVEVEKLPVYTSKTGGELVLVAAGKFTMGDGKALDGSDRDDEKPHTVAVSSFYIDKMLVTQELYKKVMGANPSKRENLQAPIEGAQWTDAATFCNKCSELDGLTPCYNLNTWECNFAADGYRLPTEAEWEYACRAKGAGKYSFGDDAKELPTFAWFKANSKGKAHPVGALATNSWGLYDMHGNVWQWCNDWYGENYYENSPKEDPRGPSTGKKRVLRGGAWDSTAEKCRAAYRHKDNQSNSDACFGNDPYGFRRVRSASP